MISVTKYVQIERPVADTFRFLADVSTMPKWAIHNVKSIRPAGDGKWEMETPRGTGYVIPHYQFANGILDHEFIDAGEGRWAIRLRCT